MSEITQKSVDKTVSSVMDKLNKEFLVVGKKSIRVWHAWLVIGLVAGLITGISLVANRSGELNKSTAFNISSVKEGTIYRYIIEDINTRFSEEKTVLITNTGNYTITGNTDLVVPNSRVRIKSSGDGNIILSHTSQVEKLSSLSPILEQSNFKDGAYKVAAIIVSFPDVQDVTIFKSQIKELLDETTNYYDEVSYGKVSVDFDIYGPYNSKKNFYDIGCGAVTGFNQEAVRLADADVDFTKYTHILTIIPENNTCKNSGGAGFGPALYETNDGNLTLREAYISRDLSLTLIAHELGHTFGLGHANFVDCANSFPPVGLTNCDLTEYGDYFDVMGFGLSNFQVASKYLLGYVTSSQVVTVLGSGEYKLAPLQSNSPNNIKGLRILRDGQFSIWIDYQRPSKFYNYSANSLNGAFIRLVDDNLIPTSYIIDASADTPGPVNEQDVVLKVGKSIYDPVSNYTIKTISQNDTELVISITKGNSEILPVNVNIIIPSQNTNNTYDGSLSSVGATVLGPGQDNIDHVEWTRTDASGNILNGKIENVGGYGVWYANDIPMGAAPNIVVFQAIDKKGNSLGTDSTVLQKVILENTPLLGSIKNGDTIKVIAPLGLNVRESPGGTESGLKYTNGEVIKIIGGPIRAILGWSWYQWYRTTVGWIAGERVNSEGTQIIRSFIQKIDPKIQIQPPDDIIVTPICLNGMAQNKVEWSAVSDAVEYNIDRKLNNSSDIYKNIANTSNVFLLDKNVTQGIPYRYKVQSRDSAGNQSGYLGDYVLVTTRVDCGS